MSKFMQGQTNKTLEKLYPNQYLHLSPESREAFYESLSEEETIRVKVVTTLDLGAGFNRFVVNDDLRPANFMSKQTFGELKRNVMKVFLEQERDLKVGDKEIAAQPEEELKESPIKRAYLQYKAGLSSREWPPVGVSLVGFEDPKSPEATFFVFNTFDIQGLLGMIFEMRFNRLFAQKFPLTLRLIPVEQHGPAESQEMQVRCVNVPDTQKQLGDDELDHLNLKFINAKEQIKVFLLDEFQQLCKRFQLEPGFYYAYDKDGKDLLLPYYLDEMYAEEPEDYIKSGWAVVVGEPDFSKNLLEGENFEPVKKLLDEAVALFDPKFYQIIESCFGEEYKSGW